MCGKGSSSSSPSSPSSSSSSTSSASQSVVVVVHPLVLLSVVDHFNRMGKIGNQKRVVGVLLGSWSSSSSNDGNSKERCLDVSNSFAVPFDEDERDLNSWYLDHGYLEQMYQMFKKVNAKERIVGWYHTGPKLHRNDVLINDLIRKFACSSSSSTSSSSSSSSASTTTVLVIVDAEPRQKVPGLPTEAYRSVEEVHDDGTPTTKTFEHVPSMIGAEEAEEVGVEHLLRDIKDTLTDGTLSQRITNQLLGLKGLGGKLLDLNAYLQQVVEGKMPMNHQITYLLQDIFNLVPDLTDANFVKSINVNTNDQMLVIYAASLIRSIIALHNLINNKLSNKEAEKEHLQQSAAIKKEAINIKDGGGDKDKDKKDAATAAAAKESKSKK